MSSQGALVVSELEYREAGPKVRSGLHLVEMVPGSPQSEEGLAAEQMRREAAEDRERTTTEIAGRIRQEVEAERDAMMRQFSAAMERFERERVRYFAGVEQEVVRLSLSVARKILQREAELDPTLLSALVRIALERMDAGSDVRIRVPPKEAERWRTLAGTKDARTTWEVLEDATLVPGDCIVETALGKANFSFDAQLVEVEQSFHQLLAQRPEAA